jgi:Tfp pilus assembly protein PilX
MTKRDRLKSQTGVSLVMALLILLVLTLIAISAISTTTFETNIAGNERLYN